MKFHETNDNHLNKGNKYPSSTEFKKDVSYWNKQLSDIEKYVKFHNIQSDNYNTKRISFETDTIGEFLKDNSISKLDFMTSIFSLYLSRIDNTEGCLLKTNVKANMDTMLKIPYNKNSSFMEHMNQITEIHIEAIIHTGMDIENYIDETISHYAIYDFNNVNRNFDANDCALALNVLDDSLELTYNCDLFEDIYIEHMLENITSLIGNVFKSPNQTCGTINILSEHEENSIFEFSKGKSLPVEENKTFSQQFSENAVKYPNNIAIDDGNCRITYSELEQSSNSIAYDLKNNYNILSNKSIGLMLPRNYHFPELALALNKLGIAMIPIDPSYPIKRIRHMLDICKTQQIITTKEYEQNLDGLKSNIIFIEDLNRKYDENIEIRINEDDMFAIMFTSGTTGLPKGVMISNRQINSMTTIFADIFNVSGYDTCGCYFNFSFIGSFRLYCGLILGECCRIFNEKEQKDNMLMIESLKNEPMNDIILPPSVGVPLVENEELKVKKIGVAGSKLNEVKSMSTSTQLINLYGTSETLCAVFSAINDNINVPLGKPAANTEVYILDDNGMQLPIGVSGEICISSDYLSQGYYNNPELTKKAFIANPYSDNRRLYRTGDIGFYNFNGEIEIVGRKDNQLSVRGFRVESGEIITIMEKFESINDIYLDIENDNLIAYYTTEDVLNIDDVKDALKNELPYYMIPSLFIELDEIPLNANGKIDKFALRNINHKKMDIEITDDVLKGVLDGFKEVLNSDFVLIDDDFVRLGGSSLSAMNLQIILKDKFGVSLSSNEIVELSTPAHISDKIKFDLKLHSHTDMNHHDFESLCPLSESQLNIYLDEKVKVMGTAYNNSFKIKFNKNYSTDEIKKAINKLFEVYPILKARVINNEGAISFIFDGTPEISEGTMKDMASFIRPFELDKHLSRFLIIKSEPILCINCHHLIFDGTSINVLLDSLHDILNNRPVDFVDDGILRQLSFEEHIDQKHMDDGKKFFEGMLADRDEVYGLLNSINPDDEFIYDDVYEFKDVDLTSFLQNNNITYNQFFSSVFAYTLSRFTGSSKAMFNLIEDGRGHIDLSDSIGMFVKTLPILIDCANQDISSFLEYSSNLINSAMKYDLCPFRILANEYNLNSNITFQYAHEIFNMFDNDYSKVEIIKTDSINDLSFFVYNIDDNRFGIKVTFSDKLSLEMIQQFVKTFKLVLKGMTDADNLSDIEYTDMSDLAILDDCNKTETHFKYPDILEIFNENLSKYPDNNLVSMDGRSYSYSQGAYIADKIAIRLREMGIKSQECVGFLTSRGEYYMFAVLGILSVGAINVPLDDNHPDERLSFILKDTDCKAVIVSDETCKRMNELNRDIAILNISDIVKEDEGTLSNLPTGCGNLASILYTSGSTGVPKGVKITRKAILNVAVYYRDTYELNHDDVYALYPSIGFDAGFESIFKAISVGACLSIVPEEIKYNMRELNNYFIRENVTHAIITTQVGKLFMQSVDATSLKYLFVGGEKLGKFPSPENYKLIDEYGPTEGTNFISSINNNDKMDYSSVGWLNYNTKAYIIDKEYRRVPIGAVGELCISGHQIADGYLNRDEESKKSFVDNPFSRDENYRKMYRTGDLVRILPDGSLAIVGRSDGQVKIRGNRVELSEIESTIREIDFVSDVTVQTIKEDSNNKLVAYVVTTNEMDESDLKDYISDYIAQYKPDYMVPSYVIKLDEIPLTVNSKVDKKALPQVNREKLQTEYVAGESEAEKLVIEAFQKVFNQEKIGLYDDFTSLGGDSLTAIKLLYHLDNPQITAADILTLRTPHAISKKINDYAFNLDFHSLDEGCPLNESQLNVYLDILVNSKTDSYIIPLTMDIDKKYDLYDGLVKMIESHPILGMRVNEELDVPYLIKSKPPEIIVKSKVSEEFIHDFKTKPFDLNKNLCRFLIVENDLNYDLLAVFHHIIFDGISDSIFKKDLMSILEGENVDVDDSFLKVSAFNQQISKTEEFAKAHNFFDSMLAGNDEAGTLLDDVYCDGPGSYLTDLNLDNNLLNEFLKEYEISENILFTSAFAYTLSRFAGNDKVLFNIVENGRDRFNNFDAIGMYVNTLPLLVECKNQSIDSFINSMSNLIYDVMKFNYYPFRFLASEYNLNADTIFQYMPDWFNKNDNNIQSHEMEGMTDFISDFSCEVIQVGDDYKMRITFSDKYSTDTIKRFSQTYNLILSQMIDVDNLGEINYNSPQDLELLNSYNQTECELQYNDIIDAFRQHLYRYPDNKLVSMDGRTYTYGEGAFIIKEIVGRLNELEIEPNDCISFLVHRSEWYSFSSLAILSMGCVYVPLDDGLPDERIKFILEDTKSKAVIVTDETYERAKSLTGDCILLNVSDILSGSLESSNNLDVNYGHLACILYTSGTTGTPKGVKITRLAILNASTVYVEKYGMNNDDVYGLYASIGFDVGSLALWATVYAGASLAIIPENIKLDMIKMNEYLMSHEVTFSAMTTQVAKLFIRNIKNTSLKLLSVGGEKLGKIESPDYKLIDEFGPTEAFGFVSSINNLNKIHPTSVGLINYNTKAYVLDDEGRRVPYGAVGQLYLAGYQIADGYLNREKETDNAFIDNPFDDGKYNRLYRTGDIVRYLPDGTLAILGRQDGQVKIRGNRVELSEVEQVIRDIDNVKDVTVQIVTNGSNNELVAYVVLSEEIKNIKNHICDYVGKYKPNYMVPSFVVALDEIPLNINGKVDKGKLPKITVESEKEYEHPENFIERAVATGFSEVLGLTKPVGRNDEFNALGGDSISVMQLIVKLRELNLHISVKEVLENQSVKKIAQKVEYKLSANQISQETFEGFVDATPITNYFWDSKFKDPSYFNQALLFEASEKIDEEILKKAMQIVVNHHDMLRAIVKEKKLFVRPQNDDNIFTIEYCNPLDYANETERINREIDIFNGPLIKLAIFEEENENYLYISIHHLIVDGISWRIILEDLNLAYMQLSNNDEITLPSKTSPYQDYALAINKYKNDKELLKQKTYWETVLTTMKNLKHTKIDSEKKTKSIQLIIPKEKASILLTTGVKNYDSSINGLFLSIIFKSWKKTTGENEFSMRIEGHGRENFDKDILIERTVGWFSIGYPLILKSDSFENDEIISDIEGILDGVPQKGFGYPPLMGIETDEAPLMSFNYLGEMNAIKSGEMFTARNKPNLANPISEENDFSCDITINGYALSKEIIFSLRFNTNQISESLINTFSKEIMNTFDEIAESCDEDDYTDDINIFSTHPDKKNLFIIHSANFGSEFFYYLGQKLKDDYSFSVIEPYNLNHKETPLTSIEEFAEKYIKIIKSIQPEGPYYIGGFCFGGAIAHEMAIQLTKQNEKVEKLIIFDANNIEDKELKKTVIEDQIIYAHKYQQGGILNPKELSIEDMVVQSKLAGAIWQNYKPGYYDGETIFFKSTEIPENISEGSRKMYEYLISKKAGGYENYYNEDKLKIIKVPVEHNNIFSNKGLEIIIPELKKFIE